MLETKLIRCRSGWLYFKQLNFKYESGVSRNRTYCLSTIGKCGRNNEYTCSSFLHTNEPLVPSGNYLSRTKSKLKRCFSNRAIKHSSILEFTSVINGKYISWLCDCSSTNGLVLYNESGCSI